MRVLALVMVACFFATGALAQTGGETKAFQLSLVPDVAIHPKTTHIKGISLNLWGENPQTGFAFGLVNGASGKSTGLLWGIFANYSEDYKGAQVGAFVNYATGEMTGFQWATFNYAAKLNGLQLGVVNYAKAAKTGFQVGLVNILASNQRWFANLPHELAPGMVFVNWSFSP